MAGLGDLGVDFSFGLGGFSLANIASMVVGFLLFVIIVGGALFILYLLLVYKYRVLIYEINNDRLVYTSDIGREVRRRDGKQYFRLFWNKKTLPPLNYNLVTPARKGFKKHVVHLIRESQEGFNAINPKLTNQMELMKEINELNRKKARTTDEDEVEDIDRMIHNRETLLNNVNDDNILEPIKDKNGNKIVDQFNAEHIMKSFVFEPVDLDVKNTHINMAKTIEGYKGAGFMEKYGSIVISLGVLAISFVLIVMTLEQTNDIIQSIGQINSGLTTVAEAINQGLVK